tara:strand:+ start:421 stop:2478 length:2058 start_codon:yes stop_codon:yes gene_type:complete
VSKFHLGSPWPLGSTITQRGINFSVAAPNATRIELLIFKKPSDQIPNQIITLDKKNQSGDYWHIEVEGLSAGCNYCYRVFGSKECEQNHFYLLDPCARSISGWDLYKRLATKNTSKEFCNFLKSTVCERDLFDFQAHPRPRHSWDQTVIYELHVGGFTSRIESEVANDKKGTFKGLIEKIPYLKDLGVTTIELLPVFAFDPYDSPFGVKNYWGYSPINWFTPHIDFIVEKNPLNARIEFREFVAACHDEGLEVLLDVVYNHTAEGNENGPIISWKGFGDSIYYHKDKKNRYLDVSGCGNTIAANHPITRNLILESMRCWSNELGVDGFRFDLGIALSRGQDLKPLDNPPLFEEIEADNCLSDLKLISEPWDCGGLYRITDFPAKRVKTWNGKFRDDLRKFWKGDKSCTWNLKDRLMGSPNLYKKETSPKNSINFITSHDGFTLHDLVSFNAKHNLANGENNRDGDNHNNNWNHGLEGPCTDKDLQFLRSKQQRNLLSILLLSPGIPMLLMGDEVGRSQGGNNNTWCQDSPLGWMIWDQNNCDIDLKIFVKKLINIRKSLPEFFSPKFFLDEDLKEIASNQENLWIQWHGIKLNKPDWGSWSHTISYSINKGEKGSALWIGLNAYSKSMMFELPKPISPWKKILNTSSLTNNKIPNKACSNQINVQIESRSLVIMLANEYSKKLNL